MSRRPSLAGITLHDEADAAALAVVDAGLGAHNDAEPELQQVQPLHVVLRDSTGAVAGGTVGRTWGSCCELQQLWVQPDLRDQGLATRLMQRFEARAAARGCSLVYLETFSFQAPAFYARQGYHVVLQTAGYTGGVVKFTMHKVLVPAG